MMSLLAAGGVDPLTQPMEWMMFHALDAELVKNSPISKFFVMTAVVAALIGFLAWRTDRRSLAPKGLLRNAFEGLILLIRDGMVRPAMGKKDGDKFVPFFCTCFVFVLTANWIGLVPIPIIGGTITSNLKVTGALALIIFTTSVTMGFKYNGLAGFPKLFIPGGLPAAVVPLIFALELLGFLVKHGVLALRLFAVMLAGHLVIGAFIGMIFKFESFGVAFGAVPFALFIYLLETLVGFLQAYVFTLLSVLFIGGMVHPDH